MVSYVGGKYRIARHIEAAILARSGGRTRYVEPFLGGGATYCRLSKHFRVSEGYDIVPDLVLMWQEAMKGWVPSIPVSEDDYAALRNAEPSAQRGFVGFGVSFGGKWFGGYARSRAGAAPGYDYAAGSARTLSRQARAMCGQVALADYRDLQIGADTVVYADPPYAGTTGYAGTPPFDSEEFWAVAKSWTQLGAAVFVSEYAAPAEWQCVWERPMPVYLRGDHQKPGGRVERLFYLGGGA